MKAIYWVRNDLRLHDNLALVKFCAEASEGAVVWCANASFKRAGRHRRAFQQATLAEFQKKIQSYGLPFVASHQSAGETFPALRQKYGIEKIYVSSEPGTEEVTDEAQVHASVELVRINQGSLLSFEDLPFAVSETPEVFTKFRHRVEKACQIPEPLSIPTHWPRAISGFESSADLVTVDEELLKNFPPGESGGLRRVEEYFWQLDRLRVYKETRNGMLEWQDSSKFSPWLAVGALSPRFVFSEIQRYERERIKNDSTYWLFFELLWRDYFRLILEKKKVHVFGQAPAPTGFLKKEFEKWSLGQTGDDFIDANMAELLQTGWMSNRGRQNVASFLAKTLNVPWQWGADYFERHLIDYDVASNWGNWAYLAGVGQDPRDRKFNSARQAEMYDPEGLYRRKWLKS